MNKRRFIQCDVFTNTPTKGNGLAVIVDGDGLTDQQMQSFARWTNLAETTFLQTPNHDEADYKVRIFTPNKEMPFAGHPTLGSCCAWLHCGGISKEAGIVRQQCNIGIVEIDLNQTIPAFVAPTTEIKPLDDNEHKKITAALNIAPEQILHQATLINGPTWNVLELASASDVLDIDALKVKWPQFNPIGLFGRHPENSPSQYEVRMLAPSSGLAEDPITGSLNAAIAQWLFSQDRLTSDILVTQGKKINRDGQVFISIDKKQPTRILIGGETQIIIDGHVTL